MKKFDESQFRTTNHSCLFGRHVNQHPKFVYVIDKILSGFDFARIVELGTFTGNLSLYFLLWALERNSEFLTYDLFEYEQTKLKKLLNFDKHFRQVDILFALDEIAEECGKPGKTVLFCDNGNKIIEFNALSDKIKKGDMIITHDWGVEIKPEQVEMSGLKKLLIDKETQLAFFERL